MHEISELGLNVNVFQVKVDGPALTRLTNGSGSD